MSESSNVRLFNPPTTAALEAAGADFRHVIKMNYYCVDSVVNTAAPPASTFVVVRKLARPEFLIEVEAVAVVV